MSSTIVRFPEDDNGEFLEAIRKSAKKNRRSLNSEMLRAFEFYLKEATEAQPDVKPIEKEATKKKSPK